MSSVWEGARRPLLLATVPQSQGEVFSGEEANECILWVDGTEGTVRAMDMVTSEAGPEVMVRALIQAMEHPQSLAQPSRPQKIVVSSREIQFFLRGALQDLDIAIDYTPHLPLIDEIFRSFQEAANVRLPQLPSQYVEILQTKAQAIWDCAPWEILEEQQILTVELNRWDIGTLYVSIMGMLGMEYGLLLYRSLDSLKEFRQQVLAAEVGDEAVEALEEAFLKQDCLFVTFEKPEPPARSTRKGNLVATSTSVVQPSFGTIHPLEGLRPTLYEDEASAVFVALEALLCFFKQHQRKLAQGSFPAIRSQYSIATPLETDAEGPVAVTVSTLPELAAELEALADAEPVGNVEPVLQDDLIPVDAIVSLGSMPWEPLETLRLLLQSSARHYQAAVDEFPEKGDGFPVIIVQTTRSRAQELIQEIQESGGLQAICFNPGADPFQEEHFDLGILQTVNGSLHLFGEYSQEDRVHQEARKKWDQRCKKTRGHCGLIVAMGATGKSRGNPQLRDMLGLFEVRSITAKELGLGVLEPRLELDWL